MLLLEAAVNAGLLQAIAQVAGLVVIELRDLPEPGWAHRGHVDAGAEGEEPLVRADVARGLLSADVLLARLEGQAERAFAVGVGCLADESAGHLANVLLLGGEQ